MDNISIDAVGIACSLGLRHEDAFAALRVGFSRATELDFEVYNYEDLDDEKVTGHVPPMIVDGCSGVSRIQQLCLSALQDLVRSSETDLSDGKTGIFLLISDGYYSRFIPEDFDDENAASLWSLTRETAYSSVLQPVIKSTRLNIALENQYILSAESAGFTSVLKTAIDHLSHSKFENVIVGAVDSLADLNKLPFLNEKRLLKTPNNPVGFMPGDAACFISLSKSDINRKSRFGACLTALSNIHKDSGLFDAKVPSDGSATAKAILDVFGDRDSTYRLLVNLNGHEYRAKDFGTASVRLNAAGINDQLDIQTPVEAVGEVGVAFGPICLGYSAFLLSRTASSQNMVSSPIIVGIVSDDGQRSAFKIEAQT